jgi:hypothetical protein
LPSTTTSSELAVAADRELAIALALYVVAPSRFGGWP